MRRAHVDLHFAPNWELIDPAREFLQSFFAVALENAEIAGQVGLAAHELMENAIKYSPNDEAWITVEVEGAGPVRIIVENDAHAEHLPVLQASVRAIAEASDALAYYRARMEEASTRSDGKSCLGLARIRWEAGMTLDCQVQGSRVRIIAIRDMQQA